MTEEQAAAMLAEMQQQNVRLSEIFGTVERGYYMQYDDQAAFFAQRAAVVEIGSVGCGLLFAVVLLLGLDRLLPR
jgi:hypothetical protein